MKLAYLTDVEGMWTKLQSFAEGNPSVRLDADGKLQLGDGVTFVFGGDAIDRGPAGRRVVATLLEAKERLGDRVVLLAGNRDINKLRLSRELSGHPPLRAPDEVRSGSRPALLRWIFANTMGARDAFEHRRTELGGGAVSDEAVVESFLSDLSPGGPLADYLSRCQLGFRAGRTLFVHGGIAEEALGFVPTRAATPDPDAWVAALNAFYDSQLEAYRAGAIDADGQPAWTPLLSYQAPKPKLGQNPESVVYGRTVDAENNPLLPPRAVTERLRAVGIDRLVVGHTPTGDVPAIVRGEGFELVVADNSHGRVEQGSRLLLDDEGLTVDGRAQLDGGEVIPVHFRLQRDEETLIGTRPLGGPELVVGPLSKERFLLFTYGPRYEAKLRALDAAALTRR